MSRLLRLSAIALVACQVGLACACTSRHWSRAERDAPLSTPAETSRFRELLATALDREALYTLAGGLKPLSTGFWHGEIEIAGADLAELEAVRRALAPLRDGIYYADVQVFSTAHDGKRALEAYVVHLDSLAAMIEREKGFWSPLGISPSTHPSEIVAVVDRLPRPERWRAYGFLFGYPRYAIDFFVEATSREGDFEMGPGKDRDFFHVPTVSAAEGRFTWAVPRGHAECAEDRAIRHAAARILESFQRVAPEVTSTEDPMPLLRKLNQSNQVTPCNS
jgi:hypothetical protein